MAGNIITTLNASLQLGTGIPGDSVLANGFTNLTNRTFSVAGAGASKLAKTQTGGECDMIR